VRRHGQNAASFLPYSSTGGTASVLTVTFALGIHELRAIGQEQSADPLVGVGGIAQRQAEAKAGLLHFSAAARKASHVQACVFGRLAGRIERLDVDARMLLHHVDTASSSRAKACPGVMGTPSHLPSNLPRYSTAGSIGPFVATTLLTTSLTGSSAWLC